MRGWRPIYTYIGAKRRGSCIPPFKWSKCFANGAFSMRFTKWFQTGYCDDIFGLSSLNWNRASESYHHWNQFYKTTKGQQKLARVTALMGNQTCTQDTKSNKTKEQNKMKPTSQPTNQSANQQPINHPSKTETTNKPSNQQTNKQTNKQLDTQTDRRKIIGKQESKQARKKKNKKTSHQKHNENTH